VEQRHERESEGGEGEGEGEGEEERVTAKESELVQVDEVGDEQERYLERQEYTRLVIDERLKKYKEVKNTKNKIKFKFNKM
jgi:hypothetical protein